MAAPHRRRPGRRRRHLPRRRGLPRQPRRRRLHPAEEGNFRMQVRTGPNARFKSFVRGWLTVRHALTSASTGSASSADVRTFSSTASRNIREASFTFCSKGLVKLAALARERTSRMERLQERGSLDEQHPGFPPERGRLEAAAMTLGRGTASVQPAGRRSAQMRGMGYPSSAAGSVPASGDAVV